jgi:hypothetical protein
MASSLELSAIQYEGGVIVTYSNFANGEFEGTGDTLSEALFSIAETLESEDL